MASILRDTYQHSIFQKVKAMTIKNSKDLNENFLRQLQHHLLFERLEEHDMFEKFQLYSIESKHRFVEHILNSAYLISDMTDEVLDNLIEQSKDEGGEE